MPSTEAQKRAVINAMKRNAAAGGTRFSSQFDPETTAILAELVECTGWSKTKVISEALAAFHATRITGGAST